tara:strand:- start:7158 stop:7652 length:495 start_codon:yes stop_codon:yes gene_type:complete
MFASSIVVTSFMSFSVTFAVPSAPPALLTKMDTSANALGSDFGSASTASVSVTSNTTQCTVAPYRKRKSLASSSSRSSRLAATTKRHPSSASLSAVALPIPDEAPVINAHRPSTGTGAYSSLTMGAGTARVVGADIARVVCRERRRTWGAENRVELERTARMYV